MNKNNSKILKYTFLIIALVLTLSPFLYLAQYNHPSADDFCYSSKASYLGFVATQVDHWITWSGRYTATALLSIFTVDHNNLFGYRLFPVILFIFFGFSIFVFLRSLFTKAATYDICALTFVIFFLYILKASNITEAFYWLAGSVTYQVASILSLFLFSIILHLLRQREKSKLIFLTIVGSILGIVIVGLNEISLIYLCITLFLWLIFRIYSTHKPEWGLIIIVCITFLAAGISLTAPGNSMRMSTIIVEQFNLRYSLSTSAYFALLTAKSWLPFLLLLTIIFWDSFKRISIQIKNNLNFSISWVLIILLIYFLIGLVVLGYFPTFWSQGWKPPTRTVNVILLVFIIGGVGIILLAMIGILKKWEFLHKMPSFVKTIAVVLILSFITLLPNNVKTAYKDIFSGKAIQFDKEMQERYLILRDCEEELCDIPLRLTDYPPTIFAYELGLYPTDEIYYYNYCLKDYIHETYTPPERVLRE